MILQPPALIGQVTKYSIEKQLPALGCPVVPLEKHRKATFVLDSPGINLRSVKLGSESKPSLTTESIERKPGASSNSRIWWFGILHLPVAVRTMGRQEETVTM